MQAARIGFITEFTLYGPRYGTPRIATSDWPCTSTSCWRCTFAMVFSCTGSIAPALIPVSP